jgi:hypothetical protein
MQSGYRLRARLGQKIIVRITVVTAGIALMFGIGFFVVANFGGSAESLASGELIFRKKQANEKNIFINTDKENPVKAQLTEFSATSEGRNILLKWTTKNENGIDFFSVERSGNGNDFAPLALIPAQGSGQSTKSYQLIDDNPLPGISHYKISFTGNNISVQEFPPVEVEWTPIMSSLTISSISPNPFTREFLLKVNTDKAQSLGIFLYDAQGRRVAEHTTEKYSGTLMVNMNPGEDLPAGIYVLAVIGEDMIPHTIRLQKQ